MTTTSTPAGNAVSHDPVDQRPGQDAGMTTTTRPAHAADPQPRRARDIALWLREGGLGVIGYAGVLVVACFGWKTSFIGLHNFSTWYMHLSDSDAWGVPITFDGGAAVLSLVVARAAMNGRSAIVWRLGVLSLTLLSSWINWQDQSDPHGKEVACLLPIVAVGAFEGLMSEARQAYERREHGEEPRLKLTLLRWVFAPLGTFKILKAHVLGQELPQEMAKAAEQVAATEAAERAARKPRRKAHKPKQAGKAAAKPAEKPALADATEPVAAEQDPRPAANAEVISLTKSKDSATAIQKAWIDNRIANRRHGAKELSLNEIDKLVGTSYGYASKVIKPEWIATVGDPSVDQALNGERRHG